MFLTLLQIRSSPWAFPRPRGCTAARQYQWQLAHNSNAAVRQTSLMPVHQEKVSHTLANQEFTLGFPKATRLHGSQTISVAACTQQQCCCQADITDACSSRKCFSHCCKSGFHLELSRGHDLHGSQTISVAACTQLQCCCQADITDACSSRKSFSHSCKSGVHLELSRGHDLHGSQTISLAACTQQQCCCQADITDACSSRKSLSHSCKSGFHVELITSPLTAVRQPDNIAGNSHTIALLLAGRLVI